MDERKEGRKERKEGGTEGGRERKRIYSRRVIFKVWSWEP